MPVTEGESSVEHLICRTTMLGREVSMTNSVNVTRRDVDNIMIIE